MFGADPHESGATSVESGDSTGRLAVAAKLTECCNPLAKSDRDRCDDCPMRSAPVPASEAAPKDLPKPPSLPGPQPQRKQSMWAFLNGDITRD